MKFRVLALSLFILALGASAMADDVPVNLIVTRGNTQWAYADPCAATGESCNASGHDLTMHDGWQIATAADFSASFSGISDLYNAFTNPAELCASKYFDSGYSHCDTINIFEGYVFNNPWNDLGQAYWAESFAVREASPVPEPTSILLLGSGLLGGVVRRLRRK